MAFEDQPTLQDETFLLRPLVEGDRAGLREAAGDPGIWAQHPIKDRHKPSVFDPYFDFLLENGGTLAIVENRTGRLVGCSRYYATPDIPDSISIGYTFLIRDHWGGQSNWRVKTMMLDHAFNSFGEVWLHIGPDNLRSQRATAKLGARHIKTAPTEMVGSTGEMAWFRLSRDDWAARKSQARRVRSAD